MIGELIAAGVEGGTLDTGGDIGIFIGTGDDSVRCRCTPEYIDSRPELEADAEQLGRPLSLMEFCRSSRSISSDDSDSLRDEKTTS